MSEWQLRHPEDWHPDRETLEKFLDDDLSEEEGRSLQRHLFSCAGCEQHLIALLPVAPDCCAADSLQAPLPADLPPETESGYIGLLRQVLRETREEMSQRKSTLSRERTAADHTWEKVRDFGFGALRELVWEDPRFQSWGFFELLVDKAREAALEEPRRAEELLRVALDVTEHLDPELYGNGAIGAARTRAWSNLGNALRILGDFRQAEQAFLQAEAHFETSWLDPLDEALLLELKASLRRAQRRFADALQMLDNALELYREVNEPHLQGRTLMAKGLVLRYAGDFEAAGNCFRSSLFLLDGAEEPRLMVLSQSNLIGCLYECGRCEEALSLIPEARKLMEEVTTRTDLLRLRWLEGQIAVALGREEEAEPIFLELIEVFTADRLAFDAALVSLDLAAVYARQGRTADVKQLAGEMLPIFQSCDVHREAIAAMIVFQKAAEMEQLSVSLVEEVSSFLQRVRSNPSLRFRGDSERQDS